MVSTYTANSGIQLPANGEQSGTWGETINDNMDIIDRLTNGVGAISLSGTTHTLTITDGTLSEGQYNVLVLGGSPSGTNTITITPNDGQHVYIVKNSSGQSAIFTQGSGGDITLLNGETKVIYSDGVGAGSAVVDITNDFAMGNVTITGGAISGATLSTSSFTLGGIAITATGTEINILDGVTATAAEINILDGVTATAAEINILDGVTATAAEINILDGVTATTAEINYVDGVTSNIQTQLDATAKLAVAQSFTAKQTFAGSASVASMKTSNIAEVDTIAATAATGTIDYDVTTQSVLFYTTDASGNWTLNLRGSSGTSLDTLMATGESLSVTFLVTQGATAYYNSAVTIDGSSVTPKWQGGTAPTIGNASSVDCYTYVIQKTGAATYVVLASQTQFA
jgi:hypothetical protein